MGSTGRSRINGVNKDTTRTERQKRPDNEFLPIFWHGLDPVQMFRSVAIAFYLELTWGERFHRRVNVAKIKHIPDTNCTGKAGMY